MTATLPRAIDYYQQWSRGFITGSVPYHYEQLAIVTAYFQQWLDATCWVGNDTAINRLRKKAAAVTNMQQLKILHQELIIAGIDPIE